MKNMKKMINIIVPAYNEETAILLFYQSLADELEKFDNYSFSIIFINDGSNDNTLPVIKDLKDKDNRVGYISLSRNYGKEIALAAGFDIVKGDAVIIMDADLQHPPEILKEMIRKWEEGYDDIYAIQKSRKREGLIKKIFTKIFYNILSRLSRIEIQKNAGDFRLLSKKAYEAIKKIRESERYTKGIYALIGFKKFPIEYECNPRITGKTKWAFRTLFNLAANGITSFTTIPLRIASLLGMIISIIAFIYMIYNIIITIFYGESVRGYPTLLSVILILGGIQLIGLGIIGEYLGRVFNETKNRPLYFIDEMEEPGELNK